MWDRQAGKQTHSNDDGDDRRHVETAFALFPPLGLGQDIPDEGCRDNLLKDVQVQSVTELALWSKVT
jgi:hypothetical protein